ncbi:deoxyribonuclease IV [Lentilactobacillus hilgardii]|uniref:Probable endonuclease 4 n=1 Tax=Lentilactobacillus hilgardii TaxID=1588 RepID=A0A6P1E8E6_LENHI|nr:deoxyribonuclease IV [Lentilactobacillus hilgardii]MCT3391889.1 deoxyribonuclease IV [Lentilactobacillus hilgardii]MCT3398399.1 deoxyribonuclease IV [Lentilactobacillus hilgardii]QHB52012.1 deoxyribonuclease IV [Lentilactobacillus hilgardii]RRG11421.1 MAG: deoxyribonuclease IV [Lactobacillus sp.]
MSNQTFLIGSHVSMNGKDMFLGSAKEAAGFGENVFMVYTGAPQNTVRKPIEKLNGPAGKAYMAEHNLKEVVVHAPYIINLGNTLKPQNFAFGVQFLQQEIARAEAIGAKQIVLHPGAHVGEGPQKAIDQIAKGLNEVITDNQSAQIALETMAGKGTEVGITFEQLAEIISKVSNNKKLSVTFDTCHTNDAGYDVKNDFDGVLNEFDHIVGLDRLKVIHLNDSKNERGSHKDRHQIIGLGTIGFKALNYIAHHDQLASVPKIMETPILKDPENKRIKYNPHGYEVSMLRKQVFNPNIIEDMKAGKPF